MHCHAPSHITSGTLLTSLHTISSCYALSIPLCFLHTPPILHFSLLTAVDGVPSDDLYERGVNVATTVYQLEGEGEKANFVPVHEHSTNMVKVTLLNPKKVCTMEEESRTLLVLFSGFLPAFHQLSILQATESWFEAW